MNNLDILELKKTIIGMINEFPAPMEVKRLILYEIYLAVEKASKDETDMLTERQNKIEEGKELNKEEEIQNE